MTSAFASGDLRQLICCRVGVRIALNAALHQIPWMPGPRVDA
jgi:hypothetical protein